MDEPQRARLFVEHFFRDQWRTTIAVLSARFGISNLDDIENAVQSAMTRALERWSLSGPPANPAGWIFRTATNAYIDEMRRRQTADKLEPRIRELWYDTDPDVDEPSDPLDDDVLKMVFVCGHPSITDKDGVILTLRIVCGLGFHEIASGLCMSTEAVRKALTRCKHNIVRRNLTLALPRRDEWPERLGRVLQVIYLLFNEGYLASAGRELVRDDLCHEAERLMHLLRSTALAQDGRVWALSALLAFQASRLGARVHPTGRLLVLGEQDRSRWDTQRIQDGFGFLQRSMRSSGPSRYHLEAAIAACHASATSYEQTDWPRIVGYYDDLYDLTQSDVVLLNRAVAVMELEGAASALTILQRLERSPALRHGALLPSVFAECHKRLGHRTAAEAYLAQAVARSSNDALVGYWSSQLAS